MLNENHWHRFLPIRYFCGMKKAGLLLLVSVFLITAGSFTRWQGNDGDLRKKYRQSPSQWPQPLVEKGVAWAELGPLPVSPVLKHKDSLETMIELGKTLFFDTRLSGSGKISCATCHQPELSWTDGKPKSIGHGGAVNKRNAPTIQNSWFYERLFWDGRARDLQDQAFAPINSETEMHSDMPEVMMKLRRSNTYPALFKKAFGTEGIDPDRMTKAIATFEATVVSAKSRFDLFLEGNQSAMSGREIRGLHLFRTKAGCMNCHHGPLLTDNLFHQTGFSGTDEGYYKVSHREEDRGRFKTPSLRDVLHTGPWMHDGQVSDLREIIENHGRGPAGYKDPLLKPRCLSPREIKDLLAFLAAISSPPMPFEKPRLPD